MTLSTLTSTSVSITTGRVSGTPRITKAAGIAGQSNAYLFTTGTIPTGCAVTRVGIPSAPLGSGPGGSPWPYGWGPADPNGWRNQLAQGLSTYSATVTRPSILWFHGESDANGHSNTYAADLEELITNMAVRLGRSDCIWGIVRLNIAFSGEEPVYGPIIRADVATVVAADPTQRFMINVDDLPPNPQQHYSDAQYVTIWGRHLNGVASLSGDGSWVP